jgi:putative methionine-R-sulfoxide reductase with GAF domain
MPWSRQRHLEVVEIIRDTQFFRLPDLRITHQGHILCSQKTGTEIVIRVGGNGFVGQNDIELVVQQTIK